VSHILFAWELGGGFGHLGPFRPVAEILLARGHELTVAAREVQNAHVVFGSMPIRIVQAPLCIKTYNGLAEPPLNYAEILMRYGYLDAPQLSGLLRAWRGLLDLARADLVVADHAPTALLAARGTARALAVFGGAFAVPPPVSPTPNMRPWLQVPEQRLASSDATVLATLNASLLTGTPRLDQLHEIFNGVDRFFIGVPELDPYGPRDPREYLGLYAARIGSAPPSWPAREGPRIFAYLQSDYVHIDAAMTALVASNARCLVYLRGAAPTLRQKYQSPNVAFSADLLDVDAAVAACDLCVFHGSTATAMDVLRGGKPMLLLPVQLENFLLSERLEKLGIARVVRPDAQPLDIGGALAQALEQASAIAAARSFSMRHREPAVDTITRRTASRIEALARTQG
jgi:UDP:flavonoid glycosyltransferase YjiC (YdhE family)